MFLFMRQPLILPFLVVLALLININAALNNENPEALEEYRDLASAVQVPPVDGLTGIATIKSISSMIQICHNIAAERAERALRQEQERKRVAATELYHSLTDRIKKIQSNNVLHLDGLDFTCIGHLDEDQKTTIQLDLERADFDVVRCKGVTGIDSYSKAQMLVTLLQYVKHYKLESDDPIVKDNWRMTKAKEQFYQKRRVAIWKVLLNMPEDAVWTLMESWTHLTHIKPPLRSVPLKAIWSEINHGPRSLQEAENFLAKFDGYSFSVISPFAFLHHAAAKKQLEKNENRVDLISIRQLADVDSRSDYSHYTIPWSINIVVDEWKKPNGLQPICEWEHLLSDYHQRIAEKYGFLVWLMPANDLIVAKVKDTFDLFTLYTETSVHMSVWQAGHKSKTFTHAGKCKVSEAREGWTGMKCLYSFPAGYVRQMQSIQHRLEEEWRE